MPARQLLAKIHIVKKELRLDEATYRASLENSTGKRSAAGMTDREVVKAIHDLLRKSRDPYAASEEIKYKIKEMWHQIYRGNEETPDLRRFLFRHFRISDVEFLDRRKGYEVVEALKAIQRRRT